MIFHGSDPAGRRMQLIRHVTQISVMLRVLPKHIDQDRPNRIGFRIARKLEEEATPEALSGA